MPQLIDGMVERVHGVKALVDLYWPSLRLVYFEKREEHLEPVTFVGALQCPQ